MSVICGIIVTLACITTKHEHIDITHEMLKSIDTRTCI